MKEGELHPTDEYLDIVDAQDRVIGRRLRSQVYQEHASNFRVVNAFIVNSKGQLWIPTRGAHKKISPNALDFSVGGHVASEESYDDALTREAEEELRIHTATMDVRLLGKLTPEHDGVSAFMQVYEIHTDVVPHFNSSDFTSGEWLFPEQLEQRIRRGQQTKSDLPIVLRHFYSSQPR